MPQVSAALVRSAPSSTIARHSIRRAAETSLALVAAARSSDAVKSTRVIAIALPIDAAPLQEPASSQSFADLGIPASQLQGPAVLLAADGLRGIGTNGPPIGAAGAGRGDG